MNDTELNQLLKAAKIPERPEEFWRAFPRRITSRLHWRHAEAGAGKAKWPLRFAWGAALAVGLIAAFLAGNWHGRTEANNLLQDKKIIEEMLAMFPNRVRAVVQDQNGLKVVLSDSENVPASSPLWVNICDGRTCAAAVTFSGQEIQVGGRTVTVLADGRGGILLVGNNFVWSSDSAGAAAGLKISAKILWLRT